MLACRIERTEMALAGEEHRFACRGPARRLEDCPAKRLQAGAGLGRERQRPCGWRKPGEQIDLVVDVDAPHTGRQSFELVLDLPGFEYGDHDVGALELALGALDTQALD